MPSSRHDPEQYFDEVMRALPDWPTERYIELSPKHWLATRGNLNPADRFAALLLRRSARPAQLRAVAPSERWPGGHTDGLGAPVTVDRYVRRHVSESGKSGGKPVARVGEHASPKVL